MTPPVDPYLAAVLAEPDADLPRLVYADRLEESNAPADAAHAEFIRAQIAQASDDGPGLRARCEVLRSKFAADWLAPLRVRGGPLFARSTHAQFRRGFVEVVWMPAGMYLAKADKLFAAVPVQELRISAPCSDADLAAVVRHPLTARLRALDLSHRAACGGAVAALTTPPGRPNLRVLRLVACNLSDAAAELFAEAPFDWPLTELDVRNNPLSDDSLAKLRGRFGTAAVRC